MTKKTLISSSLLRNQSKVSHAKLNCPGGRRSLGAVLNNIGFVERGCDGAQPSRLKLRSLTRSKTVYSQFGVLIRTALFFAVWFLANAVMRAAESPRRLDIQVRANGFGNVSSLDITALLQSAASEIWRHCSRPQLSRIDVYYRTDHPQTDFKRTPSGRIAIGLTAQDTHWAQFGFQFGHEFCHTLANYANDPRQLVRYQSQANFWLEESLCEAASLNGAVIILGNLR